MSDVVPSFLHSLVPPLQSFFLFLHHLLAAIVHVVWLSRFSCYTYLPTYVRYLFGCGWILWSVAYEGKNKERSLSFVRSSHCWLCRTFLARDDIVATRNENTLTYATYFFFPPLFALFSSRRSLARFIGLHQTRRWKAELAT